MTRGDFLHSPEARPPGVLPSNEPNRGWSRMKHFARAGLAVALLVGFYVLAVGLAVVLVVALVQVLRLGFAGLPIALLFALVVPVVFAVLYGVFGRSRDGEPPGVAPDRAGAAPAVGGGAGAGGPRGDPLRGRDPAGARRERRGLGLGKLARAPGRHPSAVPRRTPPARARRGPAAVRARSRVRPLRRPAHGAGRRHLPRRRDDPAHHQPPRSATPRIAAVPALRPPLLRGVAQREPPPGARGRPAQRPRRRAGGGRVRSAGDGPVGGGVGALPARLRRDGPRDRPPADRAARRLRRPSREPRRHPGPAGAARDTRRGEDVRLRHPPEHQLARRGAARRSRSCPAAARSARRSACSQPPSARSPISRTRCTTSPGWRRPRCRSSLRWPAPTCSPAAPARSTRSCWSRADLRASAPSTSRSATAPPPGCCASWSPRSSSTSRR